jgi:hypothetical protein
MYTAQTYIPSSTSGANNTQPTISYHGRLGLLSFLCLSVYSWRRSMPWIDSTEKIRRRTAGENGRFAIFSTKSHTRCFLRHGEENSGYLLASEVFLFTALSNVRTTRCDSNIRKDEKRKEAFDRTISAMTGISVMVKIVLR